MSRRFAAWLALGLLAPGIGVAGPLDFIFGAPPRGLLPKQVGAGFPVAAPQPAWEGALAQGDVSTGITLYVKGAYEWIQACQACHGATGVPPKGAAVPRLAGVSADYIAKQLYDFREGRREFAPMRAIAKALTPKEIGSLALYMAGLSPQFPKALPDPAQERGRVLQEVGDQSKALPACGNCHGPEGRGSDRLLPPLAGLAHTYVRAQLQAWQNGSRRNDDGNVMGSIAKRLSASDVTAVANYYESIQE